MSIKRYSPKFKKLVRFKQPLWLEKRGKVRKFSRQKWDVLKQYYFPKKYKFYYQNIATCSLGRDFNDEKVTRLRKRYKFLLHDKQRLQYYFGVGRFRFFQLKKLAYCALRNAKGKKLSSTSSFLFALDNRLKNLFYRIGFVYTVQQALKLMHCGHIKLNGQVIRSADYVLRKSDFISLDPFFVYKLNLVYLKYNFPFFFIRRKRLCCSFISKRGVYASTNFCLNTQGSTLSFFNKYIHTIKNRVY